MGVGGYLILGPFSRDYGIWCISEVCESALATAVHCNCLLDCLCITSLCLLVIRKCVSEVFVFVN